MPACRNCHNRVYFEHRVDGTEVREYDEVDGTLVGVTEDRVETVGVACARCGSGDVMME